jgi:hypothetical protein
MESNTLFHNITNIIKNTSDRKISINTIKTYYSRIDWIRKNLGIESDDVEDIISHYEHIITLIDESPISISSKKLTFVVLVVFSKKLHLPEDVQKKYTEKMNHYKDVNNFERRENKVADKHKDNWAKWSEVVNVFQMIKPTSFEKCQDKLIVGLYTRLNGYVLRLDFANVKVHTTMKEREYNWIYRDMEDDEYIIFLKEYKTAGKYGDFIINVDDDDMIKLLNTWFDKYNTSQKYLLTSYKDPKIALSEGALSRRIPKIFDKYVGKSINNGLLRQIKESHTIYDNPEYNDMTLNQKIELHKRLGHSLETAFEYSKK